MEMENIEKKSCNIDDTTTISNTVLTILKNETQTKNNEDDERHYISKKPKWWKRIAGRRGTPGQRKAISRMTDKGFVLPTKHLVGKYQQEISISKLFASTPYKGLPITSEDILVPQASIVSTDHPRNDVVSNRMTMDESDPHVCLEIGFGLGDVLLANAAKFPHRYYIGSEIHQPGVGSALMRMEKSIESGSYWLEQTWIDNRDKVEIQNRNKQQMADESFHPFGNLRIYPGDGVKLLGMLPAKSLNSIYLTFPDPWPKEDDHGWRVIQEETVHAFERVLKPGGCFYLATDSECFFEWTKHVFQKSNENTTVSWEQVFPCPDRSDWLPVLSKYEEKGIAEGRSTLYQCWKKQSTLTYTS